MSVRQTGEAENPAQCSDERLVAGLQRVLSQQRGMTARLVAFVAEVDARGLYRGFAYASMFEYLVHALHMSEGEAFPRIYAGRVARKYPDVLRMLERGELHLSGIRMIGPLLTAGNHAELLDAVRFKSKRAIEKLIAERVPKPDVKSGTRRLPDRSPAEPPSAALTLGLESAREAPANSVQLASTKCEPTTPVHGGSAAPVDAPWPAAGVPHAQAASSR